MNRQNEQDCDERDPADVEFLLSRQADGDLTAEEAAGLTQLLSDPSHRKIADEYRRLDRVFEALGETELPVDWSRFGVQVRRRIAAEDRRRRVLPRVVRIFTPLAAAACVAVVASVYWSALQPKDRAGVTGIEPVAQIVYSRPARTSDQAVTSPEFKDRVLAVAVNRTPPSPDWKPVYDLVAPQAAVAMCGSDPGGQSTANSRFPVF